MIQTEMIVPMTGYTQFLTPAFAVAKKSGKARMVCDFSSTLNPQILSPICYTKSTSAIFQAFEPGATLFINMDLTDGFFGIRIHEDSQHLLAVISELGKACLTRLAQGMLSSSHIFNEQTEMCLTREVMKVCVKVTDDLAPSGNSLEQVLERLELIL